jgi:peptidoglycan/LPS O-acetylase OafA/YrhL
LLLITIAAVLIYYQAYLPPVYTGVKPNIFFLIYYGSFFMFGWWLFRLPALLNVIGRSGHVLLLAGLLLFIVRMNHLYTPASHLSFAGTALETCLLVLGITGLFLKYFNNESKTWRYFSDASYWVYLTHLFIVSSTQVALLSVTGIPSWLKLIIVLAVAFGITMFTYQKFVRKTIIGEFLHGKRTS